MLIRFVIFLILNFGALALGGLFTSKGVNSDWYLNLQKAPWTPPGWMFGVAWTVIMICFTCFMTVAWEGWNNKKSLIILFVLQWIFNVLWNPIFFHYQAAFIGLVVITFLTILVAILLFQGFFELKNAYWFVVPYFIWLLIASSLNLYIYLNN
jgi:translocator protein